MDKRKQNFEESSVDKKQKTEVAIAVDEAPPIFTLIDDCCNKIFDYLSLKDLKSFGSTCKWAQKISGRYFQSNYSAITAGARRNGFETTRTNEINLNCFSKFIQNVWISNNFLAPYTTIMSVGGEYVKKMRINDSTLSNRKTQMLQITLSQIESIELYNCLVIGDFYKKILKKCDNLKRLVIYNHKKENALIGMNNDWMFRKYPTLEHLAVESYVRNQKLVEIK